MLNRLLLVLCLLPMLSNAAEDEPATDKIWSGEGALGFTSSSGNTDTQNLNASLKIARQRLKWTHNLTIDAIRNETDGDKSADRWSLRERSEYALEEKSYAFGQARYEEDKFSGFEHQASIVLGRGARFIENEQLLLDLSLGLGYRDSKNSETGDKQDGGIVTSDLIYRYNISKSSTISETALVEIGEDNTFLQSETALTSTINGSLSSKISYLVKHNSDVPSDIEKTDKIVSIALVYGF